MTVWQSLFFGTSLEMTGELPMA